MRIQIPVALLEFDEGGNTIWIHNQQGATVLRIKALGRFKVSRECNNICSHADIVVEGPVEICVVE